MNKLPQHKSSCHFNVVWNEWNDTAIKCFCSKYFYWQPFTLWYTSAYEISAFLITEAWKRYPSRAEKPHPPHYRGYPSWEFPYPWDDWRFGPRVPNRHCAWLFDFSSWSLLKLKLSCVITNSFNIFSSQQIESLSQFEDRIPIRIRERFYAPKMVLYPNSGSMSFIRKITVRSAKRHTHTNTFSKTKLKALF